MLRNAQNGGGGATSGLVFPSFSLILITSRPTLLLITVSRLENRAQGKYSQNKREDEQRKIRQWIIQCRPLIGWAES